MDKKNNIAKQMAKKHENKGVGFIYGLKSKWDTYANRAEFHEITKEGIEKGLKRAQDFLDSIQNEKSALIANIESKESKKPHSFIIRHSFG